MASAAETAGREKEAQAILSSLSKKKGTKEEFEAAMVSFKKVLLALPGVYTTAPAQLAGASARYKKLAVQGFEEAVKTYAVVEGKAEELKKYFQLLHAFYFDSAVKNDNSMTKMRLEVLSLELLTLLVGQKFGEFYSLLERLEDKERENDNVKYVCSLEKHLMEGNYSQLLSLRDSKSKGYSALFAISLEQLEGTVQKEVTSCVETAYPVISAKAAASLLNAKPDKFPAQWTVVNGVIRFGVGNLQKKPKIEKEAARNLITETLNYAKELERIV